MALKKKIYKHLKSYFPVSSSAYDERFRNIREDVIKTRLPQKITDQKILFMSFIISQPCRIHDFLLSQSLILRGAEIIPVACGELQIGECGVYGGIWGKYNGDIENDKLQNKANCEKCTRQDKLLWTNWSGQVPVYLSSYISSDQKAIVNDVVHSFDPDNYKNWTYQGMPVGSWALDVLRNNELVGDETLVKNYREKLQSYLFNILLMIMFYPAIKIGISRGLEEFEFKYKNKT